jgi:hypothetical protein
MESSNYLCKAHNVNWEALWSRETRRKFLPALQGAAAVTACGAAATMACRAPSACEKHGSVSISAQDIVYIM